MTFKFTYQLNKLKKSSHPLELLQFEIGAMKKSKRDELRRRRNKWRKYFKKEEEWIGLGDWQQQRLHDFWIF